MSERGALAGLRVLDLTDLKGSCARACWPTWAPT